MLNSVQKYINPTGGLFYHYLGLKYSHSLWRNTRQVLNQNLQLWLKDKNKVIIIGPSAGYLFEKNIFAKLDQLILVDPDPIAASLFQLRHICPTKTFVFKNEGFEIKNKEISLEKIHSLISSFNDHAIIFSNILGQLPLIAPDTFKDSIKINEFKSGLNQMIKNLSYFSFHDRLTTTSLQNLKSDCVKSNTPLDNNKLISSFFDLNHSVEAKDHMTYQLLDGAKSFLYWTWPRTPAEIHITEACVN